MTIRKQTIALGLAALALSLAAPSCASDDASDLPAACNEPIDPFKELMVVDESVVASPRARNDVDGVWSFRYAVENLAPEGMDPGEFVRRWLSGWVTPKELNGFPLDVPNEERATSMRRIVMCPWLLATPENGCDTTCSQCTTEKLDLPRAPFRLLGIVNRLELRDTLMTTPNGEGRLVFGLTQGPGDAPASVPLAMTVIFEYVLPETQTAREWASSWHRLGKIPDGEPYLAALEDLTNRFVERGRGPGGGSALGQVRTNESALNWIWQLRQFGLGADGLLALAPTWNTPPEQLNGSDTLREFLNANATAIRERRHVVPLSLRAGSADARRFSWAVDGVDPVTLRRFAEETCNGCHSSTTNDGAPIDSAFHLSPFRPGRSKVSPYLYNPARADGSDELTLRASHLRSTLCGPEGH